MKLPNNPSKGLPPALEAKRDEQAIEKRHSFTGHRDGIEAFTEGADWMWEELQKHFEEKYAPIVEALERCTGGCMNAGQYGPMGIKVGECDCMTCNARTALQRLQSVGKERSD